MEVLTGFAVLSLLSHLLLTILPDRPLKKTVRLICSLLLMLTWLSALRSLLPSGADFLSASEGALNLSPLLPSTYSLPDAAEQAQEALP